MYVNNTLTTAQVEILHLINTLNVTGDTIFNYINNNVINNRYYDEIGTMVKPKFKYVKWNIR